MGPGSGVRWENEGQRLLAQVLTSEKQVDVARRVDVSSTAVKLYRAGDVPKLYAIRKAFLDEFAIPMSAWDEPAKIPAAAPAAEVA